MAGSSFSSQSSTGQSTSTSTPVQTPQSAWGLQLSQLLSLIGQNQYQWAMDKFNTGEGVTNQNIKSYMDLAGKGAGLAESLISQYQDQFKPIMDEYIRQAQTFNSEGRQRFQMGQAESTVAQADQAGRDEAERKLQGFGINPNSGRYQDLMLTSRIQDAAARAGAGTQAALDTADRGRAMTEKAAAMGQNIPGMAVNALQSGYTGITGAENAILGMLNTGANLANTAAPLFNAADSAIKTPSQGTAAQSTNKGTGQSASSTTNPPQADKSGGGKQPSESSSRQPNQGSSPDPNRVISPKAMQGPFPKDPGIIKKDDNGNGDDNQVPSEPMPYFDAKGNLTNFGDPNFARDQQGQLYTPETTPWDQLPQAPNWSPTPQDFNPPMNPEGASPFNVNPESGGSSPGNGGGLDPFQTGPNSPQPANLTDPFGGQDFNPQPQQPQQPQNDYTPADDFSGGDYGGGNEDNQPDDTQGFAPQDQPDQSQGGGGWDDNYQPEYGTQDSSPNVYDFGNDDEEEYARGGSVRPRQSRGVLPTSGGHVSRNASPSRGRVTDDIPARLNAGEFVIPRDVTAHKGSEYFHRLIANSRKARTGMAGAPARPKMRPALPNMGRPRFVSRPMGAQR